MYALIIFAVALVLRLIHTWQLRDTPFFATLLGDASGYDRWAQRLAAGEWIGTEVFYQAPLYPYFLGVVYSVFGRDLLVVRIIQALMGSASCVLLAMAGTRLFSKEVGLIAGLGLAVWAPAIFFDSLLQKAVVDMFFMCLSLWLVAKVSDGEATIGTWASLGAALAALSLTRENGLLLVAVVAVGTVWRAAGRVTTPDGADPAPRRRTPPLSRGRRLLAFAAGLIVVFAPVVVRNYSIDGGFYLTTSQFGSNFYIGNNPAADGTYASIRFGRGAPEFERSDATEVAEEAVGRTLTPAEVSGYWTARALDYIRSQPWDWVQLTGRKVLLLFNRNEMLDTESQESYAEFSAPIWIGSWFTHFGLLVPLALAGAILTWPDRRRLWLVHAMGLTYALSVVIFFVFARYRYPLVPFLLLFGAVALRAPFGARAREYVAAGLVRGWRSWQPAAILAVAVFANWPVLSPTLMRAITENNLGTALLEQQRYDEAIRHHQRAVTLMPDYAPGYNNLGAALRAAGRLDEAVASYKKAIDIKPDFASASYNLANALLEQGKAGDSAASFRQSLQANPGSVEAHNNLGIALAQKGDAAGAIAAFRAALAVDGQSVHAHRNLGNMLYDAGQRAQGIAHLERAAALAPNEAEALYDLGTILLQEQNFAAAAARFQAVLKINASSAEAHNNLGIALASQGRIAEALTHFERAVTLEPAMADARANRDRARAALGK